MVHTHLPSVRILCLNPSPAFKRRMTGQLNTVIQKAEGEKPHSSVTVLGGLSNYEKRTLKIFKAQQDSTAYTKLPRSPQLAASVRSHPCLYSPQAYLLNQSANRPWRIVYAHSHPGIDGGSQVPSFCPLYLSAKARKPQPGELTQSPDLALSDVIHVIQHACSVTVTRGRPSEVTPALVLSRSQEQPSHDFQGCAVCRLLWGNLLR